MNILIYGCGPRALSVALYLLSKDITCTLIDPQPLSSWASSNVLDIVMRSPITFDLVTRLDDLQEFSLAKYIGQSLKYSTSQKVIESNTDFVTRKQFHSYLTYILNYVISKGCSLIEEEVKYIDTSNLVTTSKTLNYSHLIIANGNAGSALKEAQWVTNSKLGNILQNPSEIILHPPTNKKITVVGSGQAASEFAYYLSINNGVTWIKNKDYQVYQYPGPAYNRIGSKSVLGNYYKRYVVNSKQRSDYKTLIDSYTPTITPEIYSKLQNSNVKEVTLNLISEDMFDADIVLSLCGYQPTLSSVPFSPEVPVTKSTINPLFPHLTNFNMPNTNVYFTGILAAIYDGPRQNSLISSGQSAKSIVDNIMNG